MTIDKLTLLKEAIEHVKAEKLNFELTTETRLSELKIDSLDAVEVQMYYEEKTGTITKDPDKSIKTVGDLLELLV